MSCSSSLFLKIIFVFATLFFHLQLLIAGNSETDKLALLEIKAKISDDPLGVMSSWDDTLHFCEWFGVICGHRHQRVTTLDLSNSKLTGIISPHLGNLSFLRNLYFQDNNFGGTIPQEISRLKRLQFLWLHHNYIGGEIPSNISSCYNLRHLILYKNNLTGNIPSSLGNLSSLVNLDVGENNLFGNIPDWIGNLKNLIILVLEGNRLSGKVPPSIFNLSSLTDLSLARNDLEGELPSNLGNTLPRLKLFSLYINQFSGHIPPSLSNSSNLEYLDLSSNHFQGHVPSLHTLINLTKLVLYSNFLGYDQVGDLNFISSLANATNLESIQIDENKFKGNFPRILCNFSSLNFLSMHHNNLVGEIPKCIEKMVRLRFFLVGNNRLHGVIPLGIGKLQNLIIFNVRNNQLSGVIPPLLGNLTKLSIFYLRNNSIEGEIPSTIGECRSLIRLDLSDNKLNGRIPSELFNIPTMSILLNLSKNHLIGSLPEEVGQLKSLNLIDVSRNMLSGQIPNSLGSCASLEFLHMQENNFNGPIPGSLQTLKGLVWLDLSHNNLSGKIPKFLASLQLQGLNLSHNNLEGDVPIGGVFNNASGVLIAENNRLCGGIIELKLPHCNLSHNTKKRKNELMKRLMIAIFGGFSGVLVAILVSCTLHKFCQRKKMKVPLTLSDSKNFPNVSYQTLLKGTNGFSSENLIGSGAFGVVYKGFLESEGSIVAIKMFNLQYHGASRSFIVECGILRNIRHRNLIKVITACSSVDHQGREFKALVYEYMKNGSLEDWLHPKKITTSSEGTNNIERNLNLRQRLDIAIDVALALDYLHHHSGASVVHCDLKPSNVLLNDEMVAHINDFGSAKLLQKDINNYDMNLFNSIRVRGTIGYTPPEYGLGNEVTTYGDVYSFGILLLELFTGARPTDDMFKEGISLHSFVKEAMHENMTIKILDYSLLEELQREEKKNSSTLMMLEALISIFSIAIICSNVLPRERLDMSDASIKLSSIRNTVFGTRLQQQRIIQAGVVSTTAR